MTSNLLTPKRPLISILVAMIVTLATRSCANTALLGAHKASIAAKRRFRFGPTKLPLETVHRTSSRAIHQHPTAARCSTSTAAALQTRGGSSSSIASSTNSTNNSTTPQWRRAYLGIGSNMGNPFQNIANALHQLQSHGHIRLLRTSFLRQTSPMYVTNQPDFINGAVEIETQLTPLQLLRQLKNVEEELGRDLSSGAIRNGPRPIDLDILLFDAYEVQNFDGTAADTISDNDILPSALVMKTNELIVPHVGIPEREFVLVPLMDLNARLVHPVLNKTVSDLLVMLTAKNKSSVEPKAVRILPLPRGRMLLLNETIIMGILNVTPDSFSDGGKFSDSVETAVREALKMQMDGAVIVDVGGESTRPGAEEVGVEEELRRVLPVITRIRQECKNIILSIDTRHSSVAKAAIEAGADIVNDVSGGTHDPQMLPSVAEMCVPMILMHMRGNPKTMQSLTNYSESNGVVPTVARDLMQRSAEAEAAGIHRWLQVLDPGIGFAKDVNDNLSLLKGADLLRKECGNMPMLFGPSRKGFIGKITGEEDPVKRDYGTIAACLAVLQNSRDDNCESCNILRVHNVKAAKQAVMIHEAIQNAKC